MADSDANQSGLVDALDEAFWIRWPAFVGKFSPTLSAAFSDGIYLSASRHAGAWFPPLAFLLGLYFGWNHVFYFNTEGIDYLFSLTTIVAFVLVSQHGAALGAAMWLGFSLGDLHVVETSWGALPGAWAVITAGIAPRLLADAVLAVLLIAMPLCAASLTQATVRRYRARLDQTPGAVMLCAVLLRALCSFLMVFLWLSAASVLNQGVYLWPGMGARTHSLVQFWADNSFVVALVAAYAAAMRSMLVLYLQPALIPRLAQLRAALSALPDAPAAGMVPVAIALRAGFLTLVCGSLIVSWLNAAILFALLGAIFALWTLAARFQPPWHGLLERMPLVLRSAIGLVLVYIFATQMVRVTWTNATTFYHGQLVAVVSLAVFCLLLPGRSPRRGLPAVSAAQGQATAQMLVLFALAGVALAAMVWPDLVYAGTCPDFGNCAGGRQPVVDDCMTGIGLAAATCSAQKQGGEWKGNADEFSGGGGQTVTVINEPATPAPPAAQPSAVPAPVAPQPGHPDPGALGEPGDLDNGAGT